MLLSMTGFGEAHGHLDGLAVAIEIRAMDLHRWRPMSNDSSARPCDVERRR
jgi:hypothetical protein